MENDNIFFTKKNYILILIGIATFVIGYFIMSGGNPENPNDYNEDIFNFRRMTLAPFVVLSGYVIVLVGIFKKFKPDVLESDLNKKNPVKNKKK